MSIFPTNSFRRNIVETSTTTELLKEYAWDFENDDFLLDEKGKFIIVEGVEALKIRNYLSLKIYKDRFFIYKGKVGAKLKDLRGQTKNYVSLNVQSMLEEALKDDVYVTGIDDLDVTYSDGKMIVSFTVTNIYSDYSEQIEI